MIKGSFTNLRRANQIIVDAKQIPNLQDKNEELKAIKKFGAGFRYVQSKILAAFALGILFLLFGIVLSFNGIIQKTYPPMDIEDFRSESEIKGYIDLHANITGIFGTEEKQVYGNFEDMDLQLFLIVDEYYSTNKNAYAVLGMSKGHLKRLLRENPDFDDSRLMNEVRFQGLAKKVLPVVYKDYFKAGGINVSDEIPLIIAYQFKSTKIQSLMIFCVLSATILIITIILQYVTNKKYRPKLAEHEIFVKNLLESER